DLFTGHPSPGTPASSPDVVAPGAPGEQVNEAFEMFGGGQPETQEWGDAPAQYLEKIFQIVLTLPPLESAGYRRMIDHLVGVRADSAEPGPPPGASSSAPLE